MEEFIQANWLYILIAAAAVLVVAWFLLAANRKTRVITTSRDVLDEGAAPAQRNQALIDAARTIETPASAPGIPSAIADGDDLTRIKGLGPKIAAILSEQGITRFAQIADWDDAEIERIDAKLGKFQGRIRRDSWVEQAKLLSQGDESGFAARYGNQS